ncbi:LamG domain-containing protein, partial [Alistipes putredinis]
IVVSSLPMFVGGAGLAADGFPLTLPQFTVEVRFQVSNTANRNRAVFTNGGSVLLRFEDPQNDTSDHKAHSLVQFQGDGWYLNPSLSFTPNKWQHLALTYDGTKVTLYVNGTFAGSKEGVCDPNFGSANWFGGDAGGGHGTGDSWWSGCKILMSEARIWSVCRTEAQVQNNMTTTSAKSQGLEAYWRFNEGEGNTFEDCTGNGHTLKTSKTPTWVAGIKSTDTETPWP